MKFTTFSPLYIHSSGDVAFPDRSMNNSSILIVSDDEIVAKALYDYINANFRLDRVFTNENFNEALEAALNTPEHRVRRCNLALAVYNRGGCYVAQMGKSRVFQVRTTTCNVEYDSRAQVLDIYSSKAKVEQIGDLLTDDYLVLCSAEDVDEKAVKKILCKATLDDASKLAELETVVKKTRTSGNCPPAAIISHIERAKGGKNRKSPPALLKSLKYILYALIVAAIAGIVFWLVSSKPFAAMGNEEVSMSPEASVTDKAPNNAEYSHKIDSAAVIAEEEALARERLVADSIRAVNAKTKQAGKNEAEQIADEEIKVVHSQETTEPATTSEQQPQPAMP